MKRHQSVIVFVIVCALAGCSPVPLNQVEPTLTWGVEQKAGKYIFCESDKCQARTTKYVVIVPAEHVQIRTAEIKTVNPTELTKLTKQQYTVYFESGVSKISMNGSEEIGRAAAEIKKGSVVTVIGKADATGSIKNNKKLALHRSEHVKEALVNKGVLGSQITVDVSQKCCDGEKADAATSRRKQRRVDIFVETITTQQSALR